MEYIKLNDGIEIPAIGFGTFLIPPDGSAQWRLANHRHKCLLLERCCMGVVSQIKDLDNSST